MKMVLKPPFVIPKKSYSHFSSFLQHASDRSANFLTVLAGRTVKISPSPIGRGFEPGRRQDFSDRSIGPCLGLPKKNLYIIIAQKGQK